MLVRRWIILLVLAYFSGSQALPLPSSAITSSSPIPDILDGDPSKTSSSSSRTLYSIVQSCLFTFFACVYQAIHPNIPNPSASRWRIRKERLIVMAYMLLVPELVIYWAAEQWCSAREIADLINDRVLEKLETKEAFEWKSKHQWTTVHGYFIQMGGFIGDDGSVLTSDDILNLVHASAPGRLTIADLKRYSEKHIREKSERDMISKLILTLQTYWFILQCIARLAKRLELSELEVVTFAYSILNVVIFLLWSNKPLDIHRSITFRLLGDDKEATLDPHTKSPTSTPPSGGRPADLLTNLYNLFQNPLVRFFSNLGQLAGFTPAAYEVEGDARQVGRFYRERPEKHVKTLFLGTTALGVAFGAIHFMSWSLPFPTSHEQVLWRVFTVVATAFPVTFVVLGLVIYKMISVPHKGFWLKTLESIVGVVIVLSIIFYALARFGLVIQAIAALRKLPPGVFENITWCSVIPHF
ncbi:hypothetical protein BDN72DRAFT_965993 [Pluteus cervinus]|uniref:Uncharacterized protein n=1 Tax=Pluteus cervinus TaxID=181527 RepID=A0ACD3A2S8_9AGAR|nr:hypothetical protein BDN72DRAFT_965993 [Pluteus cervinus]